MKKITIVIPVYNEEFFIHGTLESASQINYPKEDFEVLVVTDGCTDGTVEAVRKFPIARILEFEKKCGQVRRPKSRSRSSHAPQHPLHRFKNPRRP